MTQDKHSSVELARGLLTAELRPDFVLLRLSEFEGSTPKEAKLVHLIHHYIADEDIFQKDTEYHRLQTDGLRRMIDEVQAEREQGDKSIQD